MNQFRYIARGLLAVIVVSPLVQARDFTASVSVKSAESDNATKSIEDPIVERQDTYLLTLSGDYDNTFLKTEVDYTGSDERFEKDSQESRSYLEGSSMLLLGALTDPMDIQFNHSRTELLGTPDAIDITNNQDERETLTVIPRVKKRISSSDLVIASVDYTQVGFLKNSLNDSERTSAQLNWLHQSTKVSQLNFQVQRTDIAFEEFSDADYVYSSAVATYSTQLRKLGYTVAAGYNRSERSNDETYGSPTYAFSITYNDTLNSLQLMVSQAITDSSMGGGNFSNPGSGVDSAYKVDQIERKNASITWLGNFICDKCSLAVSVNKGVDDYVVLPDEIESQGGALDFSYSISKKSSFSLRASKSEQQFVGDLVGQDYVLNFASASYRYEFDTGISLRFFVEQEERESDDAMKEYKEKLVGGELAWTIF